MPEKFVVTFVSVRLLVNTPLLTSITLVSGRSTGPLHRISTELPTPPSTVQVKLTLKLGLKIYALFVGGVLMMGAKKCNNLNTTHFNIMNIDTYQHLNRMKR